MTGLEYMRTVCPTTKVGKDPLREDVMDAFEDGIAEGWSQCKEKQWKPTLQQINALSIAVKNGHTPDINALEELLEQLKAL